MTEKQLIAKIRELRQIKPRKDWVILTKERIFNKDGQPVIVRQYDRGRASVGLKELFWGIRIIFQHKYAFASLVILVVLVGAFGFAQKSLPGDTLFSLKKISERSQAVFVSEKGQAKANLELANKRLDDLTKIAQTNSVKNLGPAINEYQASVSEAAKSLVKGEVRKDPKAVKEIAELTQELEKDKQILIDVYGVAGLEEEQANPTKIVVEWLMEDLEGIILTEKQQQALAQAKADFEEGNYSEALEKILFLSQ